MNTILHLCFYWIVLDSIGILISLLGLEMPEYKLSYFNARSLGNFIYLHVFNML